MNKDIDTLLSGLTDLSFTRFITTKIIKILYIVAIAFTAISTLGLIVSGFSQGFLAGLGTLIVSLIGFALSVIWIRVALELVIVVFRIADNTRIIAHAANPTAGSSTRER